MLQCKPVDDSVELRLYETPNGNCPFFTWQKKLSKDAKARIWMYLNRLREGSFAAVKPVGSGV